MLKSFNSGGFDFEDLLRRFEQKFAASLEEHPDGSAVPTNHRPGPSNPLTSIPRESKKSVAAGSQFSSSNPLGIPASSSSHHICPKNCTPGICLSISDFENALESHSFSADHELLPVTSHEFKEELSVFFDEFCRLEHGRGKFDSSCTFDPKSSTLVTAGTHEVTRAILRKELLSFVDHMRESDVFMLDGASSSASNRATIASLKRQVKEKRIEADRMKRLEKEKDIENRELQDKLHKSNLEKESAITEAMKQGEVSDRLRERVKSMKAILEETSNENEHIYFHKQRLERHVCDLRKQLLQVNHERDNAKLERDLMQRKMKEVNRHNAETKKSESLIMSKVAELQDIQKQMVEHMEEFQGGNHGAKGALNALNIRRSKLVGRIANMMTNKNGNSDRWMSFRGMGTNSSEEVVVPVHVDENGAPQKTDTGLFPSGFSGSPGESKGSPSGYSRIPRANGDRRVTEHTRPINNGLSRKFTLNNIFKSGNSAQPKTSQAPQNRAHSHLLNEQSRQVLTNRAKKAFFQDLGAMRDVIAMKEQEMDRMRREVEQANNRAARLELDLQKSAQDRKKENRNLHGSGLTTAYMELQESRNTRSSRNTIFEWQSTGPAEASPDQSRSRPSKAHFSPLSQSSIPTQSNDEDDVIEKDTGPSIENISR